MKAARFPTVLIGAAAIVGVAVATAAVTVHARSTDRRASMPAMDHMAHMHDSAADPRQRVVLPLPMQQEMLANMRDHLQTLNAVVGDIADAKFDAAASLAEARLGMSSLSAHHAAELAPYFPAPMQQDGTMMHRAASRLAIDLQDASVTRTFDAMRKVDAALGDVTSACVACHAAYRLR